MCFYIKEYNPQITFNDVVCYKTLHNPLSRFMNNVVARYIIILFFRMKGVLKSEITHYPYIIGKRQPTVMLIPRDYTVIPYTIDEGYHSYINYPITHLRNNVVVKCIIPKGATFLKNETEYVSSTIIVKKII